VIIRPSTPQVLTDLAEELNREILPLLPDSPSQVRLFMITAVLGQMAERAGEEIAVMKEESGRYVEYAHAVADASGSQAVRQAADAVLPTADLRLDAVSAEYARASEALAVSIEVALDAGLADLVSLGERLLEDRVANEQRMAGVATAGR
jgi:hypothetical protein